MKKFLLAAVALSVAIGFTSCNGGDAKLAGELDGTWKGNPAQMSNFNEDKHEKEGERHHDIPDKHKEGYHGDIGEMTCTPTLKFVRTNGTNGGTLNITAIYTVTKGVESVTTTTPIKATVNGNVIAAGTWTVKDGDEIIINLDPSKTVVNVDPASLALSYAKLTDAPQDSLNTIKERVAANIPDIIKPMLTGRIQKMHEFDDVKITGNTMTLEAGHSKMTFTKQ